MMTRGITRIPAQCLRQHRRLSSPTTNPQAVGPTTGSTSQASHSKGLPPNVGKMVSGSSIAKKRRNQEDSGAKLFLKAGLPFVLFSLGGWWVVQSAIDGKLKERAVAKNETSQTERQAMMEDEHETMMKKLNKIAKEDFNNQKRIERPEEILARRKAERERRNAWYRRYWRWLRGQE